jgi:hypothetical protein
MLFNTSLSCSMVLALFYVAPRRPRKYVHGCRYYFYASWNA